MLNNLFSKFSRQTSHESRKFDLPDTPQDEQHTVVAHQTDNPVPDINPFVVKPFLSSRTYALLITALFFLSGAAAVWYWNEAGNMRQKSQAEQAVLLDSLDGIKTTLHNRLDSLETLWVSLSANNDSLSQQLGEATNLIAEKEAAIQDIRSQNAREEKSLRAQIERLQSIQTRYETIITLLTNQNDALKAENAWLRGTADSMVVQLSDLSNRLSSQIRQTQLAEFKATAFRVEPSRKNDRLTSRAKKTRNISIVFDLNNVPEPYRNMKTLYLSITDEQGVPIASKNPQQVTINGQKGIVQVIAQQTQAVMIRQNQRVEFYYDLEDRLKKGVYTAAVYTESGLLGAASFKLNR